MLWTMLVTTTQSFKAERKKIHEIFSEAPNVPIALHAQNFLQVFIDFSAADENYDRGS